MRPLQLNEFFLVKDRGSSWKIEVLAGLSTFLSLSYIFVVNPAILSAAGINKSALFLATILGSVVATMAMAIWAKLPFAVAPGLEMNAYVAYVVVGVLGFSWQDALGAVFWSGILTVVLNYTRMRVAIINAIPDKQKSGLAAAVGVFLMLVALKVSAITSYKGVQIQGIGSLTSPEAKVFAAGIIMVVVLKLLKTKGAVLLSILGAAAYAHFLGIGKVAEPIKLSSDMLSAFGAFHLGIILDPRVWPVILVLFILDFYGSIAKFIGLTRNTSIVDESGNVPRLQEALTVDGGGTVLGAVVGTSNLITYVESAVGIGEGGRTGLAAMTCAFLMLSVLFFAPAVNLVPVAATTGALFYVGLTLFPTIKDLKTYEWWDVVSLCSVIVVAIWTFGLDKAMFAGFTTYILLQCVRGKWKEINPYLSASALLLLASMLISR